MPRKTRRNYRRRTTRRHKKGPTHQRVFKGGVNGNAPMTLVIHKGLGLPSRFRTILRYADNVGSTVAGGAVQKYIWKCNGLYDPDHSGAGHQPMYFDQMMALYAQYKVIGSKITIRATIPGTTNSVPIKAILTTTPDATAVTSVDGAEEWGMLKTVRILGGPYGSAGGSSTSTFAENWSLKRYFKDEYNTANVCGTTSTDPAELTYYQFVYKALDGSTTVSLYLDVCIDYIVDFFEKQQTPQS